MAKSKKKSVRKFITKMLISSYEWELWEDSREIGATFSHADDENDKRTITIGTKLDDPRDHAEMLIHEILEAMWSLDGKRLVPDDLREGDPTRYVFHFNHDYLHVMAPNLLTALLTSGWFELKGER